MSNKKIICNNCNEENELGSKFCNNCGNPFAEDLTNCPKCNRKLTGSKTFCSECGHKIGTSTEITIGVIPSTGPTSIPAVATAVSSKQPSLNTQKVVHALPYDTYEEKIIAILSKYHGSEYELIKNKNLDAWVTAIQDSFKIIEDDPLLDSDKALTSYLVARILTIAQGIPGAYEPIQNITFPQLPKSSSPIENTQFSNLLTTSWCYQLLGGLCYDNDDVVSAFVLQTMRECYFIQNQSVTARRKFLIEEKIRIDNGIYPSGTLSNLKRLYSSLERLLKRDEKDIREKGGDYEVKLMLTYLAPLAVPEVIDTAIQASQLTGSPQMFQLELLSTEEKQIFTQIKKGNYDIPKVVQLLQGRYDALNQQLAFAPATQMGVKVADPNFLVIQIMLEIAHIQVTKMLNHYSKIFNPKQHKDYQHRPIFVGINRTSFKSMIDKILPIEWRRALQMEKPTHNSLFYIRWTEISGKL